MKGGDANRRTGGNYKRDGNKEQISAEKKKKKGTALGERLENQR